MPDRILNSKLQPHSVFEEIYSNSKQNENPLKDSPIEQLQDNIITVVNGNEIIDGYWVWKALQVKDVTVQIEHSNLTDSNEITEAVLISIISEHKIHKSKITILRAIHELYKIEKQRAKIRLQQNGTFSLQVRRNSNGIKGSRIAGGTTRNSVYRKIQPYLKHMSESTIEHGIKIIDAIDYLNINGRLDEAVKLNEALEKSIHRAYNLMRANTYDIKKNDAITDIRYHDRLQYHYAALEWNPVSTSSDKPFVFQEENIHFPLRLPKLNKNRNKQFVIVSPEVNFNFADTFRDEELKKILKVIKETPEFEFIMFTNNLDNIINKIKFFPKNMWIGFISETEKDFQYAERQMPRIGKAKCLLVLRPEENPTWCFGQQKIRIDSPTLSVKLCDWIVIESSYTTHSEKRRMNWVSLLNVINFANKSNIPLYIESKILISYEQQQNYPASIPNVITVNEQPSLQIKEQNNPLPKAKCDINTHDSKVNTQDLNEKKVIDLKEPLPNIKKNVIIRSPKEQEEINRKRKEQNFANGNFTSRREEAWEVFDDDDE